MPADGSGIAISCPLKQTNKQTNIFKKNNGISWFLLSRLSFLELYRGRSDMPADGSGIASSRRRTIATSSTVVRSAALL